MGHIAEQVSRRRQTSNHWLVHSRLLSSSPRLSYRNRRSRASPSIIQAAFIPYIKARKTREDFDPDDVDPNDVTLFVLVTLSAL